MPASSSRRGQTEKYAVDGWLLASGKPPEITEVEKWYIDDSNLLLWREIGGAAWAETKPLLMFAEPPLASHLQQFDLQIRATKCASAPLVYRPRRAGPVARTSS